MVAAVVDYDLRYQLNGPADSTDGAEDIGCNRNVHGTVSSTLDHTISHCSSRTQASVYPSIQQHHHHGQLRYGTSTSKLLSTTSGVSCGKILSPGISERCKQHELTVLIHILHHNAVVHHKTVPRCLPPLFSTQRPFYHYQDV